MRGMTKNYFVQVNNTSNLLNGFTRVVCFVFVVVFQFRVDFIFSKKKTRYNNFSKQIK